MIVVFFWKIILILSGIDFMLLDLLKLRVLGILSPLPSAERMNGQTSYSSGCTGSQWLP